MRDPISSGKVGVSRGTAQAAGLELGHGVHVPLPILPRPHPKSQHPGITHRAGGPLPVVLHPTPPRPTLNPGRPENPGQI